MQLNKLALFAILFCLLATALTLVNKAVFIRFPYPILYLCLTFSVEWGALSVHRWATDAEKRDVSWKLFMTRVAPIGMCTALEVALSNLSLLSISVAFHTMLKSSVPMAVLGASVLFGLRTLNVKLASVVGLVCLGVALTAYGEIHFAVLGFLFTLGAVIAAGFRWALMQLLLDEAVVEFSQSQMLSMILPPCILLLIPFGLVVEGPPVASALGSGDLGFGMLMGVMLVTALVGLMALALFIVELFIIQRTSSLTLAILAVAEKLVTVGGGFLIFGDSVTAVNILGFMLCLGGVLVYHFAFSDAKNGADEEVFDYGNMKNLFAAAFDDNPMKMRDVDGVGYDKVPLGDLEIDSDTEWDEI